MSTTTMSQRLRTIAANIPTRMSMKDPGWSPVEVSEMIRALAAQAEAMEGQAIGEQKPVAWMSKDYCALYDLLCEGRDAFCLVDMSFTNPDHVCRDVARVRRREEWRIDIGARGIGYGDVTPYGKNRHATERDALVEECKRMNLEWIAPISPEARDRAIEAAEYLRDYSRTTSPELVAKYAEDIVSALRGSRPRAFTPTPPHHELREG